MSECVVRMEMPQNCYLCPMANFFVDKTPYCRLTMQWDGCTKNQFKRPSWCPIIAASPWHRVEEPPKESGKQYAVWASKGYAYCDKWLGDRWLISSVAPETVTHWMPIEPPKEDA